MQISEVFDSIQGEGPWMGYPVTFVRLFGCNLNCSFCDTGYSRDGDYVVMKPLELADDIMERTPEFVVFTGGEPTLQISEMTRTIEYIRKYSKKKIAIETNGTIEFDNEIFDVVVVSPKSVSVVSKWTDRRNVYMKFLASGADDVESLRRQLGSNKFANVPYVMPIGITGEQIRDTSVALSNLLVEGGINAILTPRLHVLLGVK